jgi:hypothetical protein
MDWCAGKGAVGDLARNEIQPLVGPSDGGVLDGLDDVTCGGVQHGGSD